MKYFAAAVVLFSSIGSAWSCQLVDSTTKNIRDVVNQHGGYPISDSQCNLMNQNNLAISVNGVGTVLNGVNVAWAVVSLQDQKTNISSDAVGRSTQVNTGVASQTVANDILYDALSSAIKHLDWEKAAREVVAYRSLATNK